MADINPLHLASRTVSGRRERGIDRAHRRIRREPDGAGTAVAWIDPGTQAEPALFRIVKYRWYSRKDVGQQD